jgi:hypothetical protein
LWALPSGTGVALALLQGSAGPLIGVAISASLLPPAVNCVSIVSHDSVNSSLKFCPTSVRGSIKIQPKVITGDLFGRVTQNDCKLSDVHHIKSSSAECDIFVKLYSLVLNPVTHSLLHFYILLESAPLLLISEAQRYENRKVQ